MPDEIAAALFAGHVHPRLFVGPDEVCAMRERAEAGFCGRVARELRRRAEQHLDPTSERYLDFAAGRAGWLANFGFDAIDPGLRDKVGAYLRERVVVPYRDTLLADPRKYAGGLGVNALWHECVTFAWTLGALYDPGRREDVETMALLASMVRRALHMGVDEQGVIGRA